MPEGYQDMCKRLFEGLTPDDMTHLPSVSHYNRNYYAINGKLLFAESDDDNFTQWYWIRGNLIDPLGGSYCSDGDRIIVDRAYW
jgi:hypothetical protein